MDGNANHPIRTHEGASGSGIPARGQMHAIGASARGQRSIRMHDQLRPVRVRSRQERARQHNLLVRRQVFFAQTYPSATRPQRRGNDLLERSPRLPTVGNKKERRIGKFHAITLAHRA